MRTYAEAVKAGGYQPGCAASASYTADAVGSKVPVGYDAATPVVTYWDPAIGRPGGLGDFGSTCPTADPGLQLVTLEVHSCAPGVAPPCSPDGRDSETVKLTMRAP
jgi:hypothetical protein